MVWDRERLGVDIVESPLLKIEVKDLDVLSTWCHYKGGRYIITGIGTYESTMESVVIYRSLETGRVWVRSAKEWNEMVIFNGQQVPRFRPLTSEEETQARESRERDET